MENECSRFSFSSEMGNATKYGAWMKAAAPERPKPYSQRREFQANIVKQTTPGERDSLNNEANRKRQVLTVAGAKTTKQSGRGEGGETGDHPEGESEENRGVRVGAHRRENNIGESKDKRTTSPGRVSARIWRRAARKAQAPTLLAGVSSPIKWIMAASHNVKLKNRISSPSPNGKKQRGKSPKTSRKLSGCARKLEAWSKDKFGSLGKLITSKRAELESLVSRAREAGVSKDITRVESELDNLLSKEEIYWKQRSRADWLATGDRNSRYFHRKASVRKKSNWIEMLEDVDGRKFTNEANISGAARRYFEALFTSSTPSGEDLESCLEMIKIEVWSLSPFWGSIVKFKGLGCVDVLRGLASCFKKEALESVCMILRGLWQARNDAVYKNRKCLPEANLVEGVLGFLKDFQSSCCALQARHVAVKPSISWSPPQAGMLKLNSDASVRQGSHRCRVGAVIRDDKGWVVAAVSKSLDGNFSPEIGELVALREGLLLARGLKLKISCVELDACNVVAMVSSGAEIDSGLIVWVCVARVFGGDDGGEKMIECLREIRFE
ncbi:hypothetical protein Dsin_018823 [Dipteronia sinensis]|uniref:RNase H type-1 domain-containing protein n=1 Tax=Dipteronia sinensis TaxID=43782 RepID=A0AAE0E1Y1_9ROSI|nr:hypothetical protein Dsin_018823 [Dipteronia sinensis]